MKKYPKNVKRSLHKYAIEAYELELNRELTKLAKSFEEWKSGKISNGELSNRVHLYETGPSRELFHRYNGLDDGLNVAYAIAAGILGQGEVPADLVQFIEGPLDFYQNLRQNGELQIPGE